MPYKAKEVVYTDANPVGDEFTGKIVDAANAAFVLVGEGGVISDADAQKFGADKSSAFEKVNAEDYPLMVDGPRVIGTPTPKSEVKATAKVGATTQPTTELQAERQVVKSPVIAKRK